MSFTKGIFLRIIFLSLKIEAASTGSEAFFEPEIYIEPDKCFFPLTTSFFIKNKFKL